MPHPKNGKERPRKRPPKHVLREAIHQAMGNLSLVGARFNAHRTTVNLWVKYYGLENDVVEARWAMADLAQAGLAKKIQEGDMRAIEFALRHIAGWTDRSEVKTESQMVVRVVYETPPLPEEEDVPNE